MHSVRTPRSPSVSEEQICQTQELMEMGIAECDAVSLASRILRKKAKPPIDPSTLMELCKRRMSRSVEERLLLGMDRMFSHPETLQCSFQIDPNGTRKHDVDLDLSFVRSFYGNLLALQDCEIYCALMHHIERVLARSDFSGPVLLTRALLIVLFCPCFMDPEHHSVFVQVLVMIRELNAPSKSDLVRHFVQMEQESMQHLLELLQQYLTITLFRQSRRQSRNVENVMEVIAMLFEANQNSKAVTHEAFYNSAVNGQEFDIEVDYKAWTGRDASVFSFCNYPFVYDSGSKRRIMQLENTTAQEEAFEGAFWRFMHVSERIGDGFCPFLMLHVRRGRYLLQDTIDHIQYAKKKNLLKCPLKVHFEGEDGVDEGGLAKEFFQLLLVHLFDADYGMFTYDPNSHLWWFRSSTVMTLEREFELAGTLLGLAIFNNHILDLQFPLVVYKKLLGHNLEMDDLKEMFPEVHRSLKWLLEMESGVSSLGFHFVVDHDTGLGEIDSFDLIPNGRNCKVTRNNRHQFAQLYMKFLLEKSIEKQFNAFRSGFLNICQSQSLKMFRPEELEQAICGRKMIDLQSLERHTSYEGGYRRSHRVIRWFWDFTHGLSEDRQRKLLSFATGSNRIPIRGFEDLLPPFTIVKGSSNPNRLPTAHTCFNLLRLPDYPTREILENQISMAIDNTEGFGLM